MFCRCFYSLLRLHHRYGHRYNYGDHSFYDYRYDHHYDYRDHEYYYASCDHPFHDHLYDCRETVRHNKIRKRMIEQIFFTFPIAISSRRGVFERVES